MIIKTIYNSLCLHYDSIFSFSPGIIHHSLIYSPIDYNKFIIKHGVLGYKIIDNELIFDNDEIIKLSDIMKIMDRDKTYIDKINKLYMDRNNLYIILLGDNNFVTCNGYFVEVNIFDEYRYKDIKYEKYSVNEWLIKGIIE